MARTNRRFAFTPELLEGRRLAAISTITSPAEYPDDTPEPPPPPYGTPPVAFPVYPVSPSGPA